jgi:hypothetical protein
VTYHDDLFRELCRVFLEEIEICGMRLEFNVERSGRFSVRVVCREAKAAGSLSLAYT